MSISITTEIVSLWDDVSSQCKALIGRLLTKKEKRLTPEQALAHPWVKSLCKDTCSRIAVPYEVIINLRAFKGAQKLKKAVFTYLATQLSQKELSPLRALFKALDANNDGKLSYKEIEDGLKGRADEKELIELIIAVDTDHSGFIEYNGTSALANSCIEFLAAAMGSDIGYYKERLQGAFSIFDKDKSGKISVRELKKLIKQQLNSKDSDYWSKIIQNADKNGDGELDFFEFLEIMNYDDKLKPVK